ncbi:MAG: DUF4493 domain-containing protein [Bacteroidaceae bacterium]|nr:DUF4493 domain-containing protein [Bacteroidaceae bacterium]
MTITCKTTSTRITVEFRDSFKSFFYDYTISIYTATPIQFFVSLDWR